MGAKYNQLLQEHIEFIEKQPLYFVATAPDEGRINISPKGLDSLKVLDQNRVIWLNYTGSGNETAAHLIENGRTTIMFCSFEGNPLILRLYGQAKSLRPGDNGWEILIEQFDQTDGARQIIDMTVDLVHTSCGFGVPLMEYKGQRDGLPKWIEKKGEEGIIEYQLKNNVASLDGKPTDIKIPGADIEAE